MPRMKAAAAAKYTSRAEDRVVVGGNDVGGYEVCASRTLAGVVVVCAHTFYSFEYTALSKRLTNEC